MRRGRPGRMGQTIRDGHIPTMRTEIKFAKLSVPDAPHSGCPFPSCARRASSATITPDRRNFTNRLSRRAPKSMQEDQGALCTRPGWRTQLGAQDRYC
ncbi:hypothetical protein TKK_0016067 [Trichogramma kaykai]